MSSPTTIYTPAGRAGEYADLAFNLFRGCPHGCEACFAPAMLHMKREEFHKEAILRAGVLEALAKEAPKFAGTKTPVLMCFSCDPFPMSLEFRGYYSSIHPTLDALEIFKANQIPVTILTKGRAPEKAFDLLAEMTGSSFGVSMTLWNHWLSKEREPRATTPENRRFNLLQAQERGIPTWVSLEPIVDPLETAKIIKWTHEIVGHYKLGKLNYDSRANLYNWPEVRKLLVKTLQSFGFREGEGFEKTYYLKKSLKEAGSQKELDRLRSVVEVAEAVANDAVTQAPLGMPSEVSVQLTKMEALEDALFEATGKVLCYRHGEAQRRGEGKA